MGDGDDWGDVSRIIFFVFEMDVLVLLENFEGDLFPVFDFAWVVGHGDADGRIIFINIKDVINESESDFGVFRSEAGDAGEVANIGISFGVLFEVLFFVRFFVGEDWIFRVVVGAHHSEKARVFDIALVIFAFGLPPVIID